MCQYAQHIQKGSNIIKIMSFKWSRGVMQGEIILLISASIKARWRAQLPKELQRVWGASLPKCRESAGQLPPSGGCEGQRPPGNFRRSEGHRRTGLPIHR